MNEEEAIQALAEAAQQDRDERLPEQAGQPTPEVQPEQPPQEDSFTGMDPLSLPEEMQPFYRSMQADYTKAKQAIAEERRLYESLGDPDLAREAVQFVTALATDPDYAHEVRNQLSDALEKAGYSPAEARAEATRQVQGAIDDADDFDEPGEVSPELQRELQALRESTSQMEKWIAEAEERDYQNALAAQMDRQEAEIRQNNPDYGDEAINAIYNLAFSTSGDLIKAADIYSELRQDIIGNYVSRKQSVPAGIAGSPISTGSEGQQPDKYSDLLDPRLEKAVAEFVRRSEAGE